MDVLVSGSSGLLGSALRDALTAAGHHPVRLIRPASDASGDTVRWRPTEDDIEASALEGIDAVVHLAGEPLLGRWTETKKRRIRDSRVQGTRLLANTLAGLDDPPAVMLSASAVGYYGDRGDEVLTENSGPGRGFLAQVCQEWELATQPAAEAGIRVVHLRTAPVQARQGDLLKLQFLPFKLGLGAKIGTGRQWFPWIHREDHVRAMLHLLEHGGADGPVNISAPEPVRNRKYADTFADVLDRPRFLTVPKFAIAGVFGRTAADNMISVSQRVIPQRLGNELGFEFRHPTLRGALEAALGR